ncbi:fasciculation and elongation protein zeta-2-like isoform X3 [Ptychodera flava]|uniref:fasciculation and elongation protein zeta-2-like isoform X3 n=1 Tax=Ptychodera flava TaxID=63121 RepID=UPI00396AA106
MRHSRSTNDTMKGDGKMAAPLASIEDDVEHDEQNNEEWQDFHDFRTSSDVLNSNEQSQNSFETKEDLSVDNFEEMRSFSIEDLVNNFDENLAKCFRNYNEKTEKIAPVQIMSQDEIMKNCKLWKKMTGKYGNVMPLDWKKSHARKLQMPVLNLNEKQEQEVSNLDLPEDGELAQQLDMHSLIVSSINQEPMFTADEVIEEIDEIFQQASPDGTQSEEDRWSLISQELLKLRERSITTSSYEEIVDIPGLKSLSLHALNELLEELESTIKEYSEVLIEQLALRDELEYEKEIKNQFISNLISVQNKLKARNPKGKKGAPKKKLKNGSEGGSFLTTVIPYHKNGPPSVETLQILNKILKAMDEDSSQVPGLLTDYILKVLVPT